MARPALTTAYELDEGSHGVRSLLDEISGASYTGQYNHEFAPEKDGLQQPQGASRKGEIQECNLSR